MHEPNQERAQETDTNNEVVRTQRALNQFEFYGIEAGAEVTVDSLAGLPLITRLEKIRQQLYPKEVTGNDISFKQVDTGADFQQVTSRRKRIMGKFYPDHQLVEDTLLPALDRAINRLSEVLTTLDETEQQPAAIRLAAVLYVFGIYLHPSADANGQMFQCAALSYLHEFNPELRDKYFPIKYSNLYLPQPHRFPEPSDAIAELPLPALLLDEKHPHLDQHRQLMTTVAQVREIMKTRFDKSQETYKEYRLKLVSQLQPLINQIEIPSFNQFSARAYTEPMVLEAEFMDMTAKFLIAEGYDPLLVQRHIQRVASKSDVATFYESKLLDENGEGFEVIARYVLDRDPEDKLKEVEELRLPGQVLLKECRHIEREMQKMLDDDFISSREALITQKQTALLYQEQAKKLEKRGLTWHWFQRVMRGAN